ncbi:MAG: hypothetical protein Q9207_000355 [Kuettlingeria erythrocarpa]
MASATAPFDYNVMQSQQFPQNGADPRNGSPAFQSPMYQTQPLVPTKRARPREDSIGASPRQAPGMLPPSRSQTPQQGLYSGYQGAVNGAHQQNYQPPNPYHRFSNAGSNASLSPSLQNQQFNAQAPPPRVQTVSPASFSPAAPTFGSQASPPPQSEHASRVNTPQNGAATYMQGMPYGGNQTRPFNAPVSSNGVSAQLPHSVQQQQQQQQQRMQEIRQRQYLQMQANNPAMQNRYPGMGVNPSMNPPGQIPGMAGMAGRVQHPQQPNMRPNNHEHFVRTIAQWMQTRGLPFNPHPTAAGRPVNLMQLFSVVIKLGGSKAVSARNQWPNVAQHLSVPHAQLMMAADEIHVYWQANVVHYESYYVQSQQQRQKTMHDPARMQRSPLNGEVPTAHDAYSPMEQIGAHRQESQPHAAAVQPPNQNGYLTPTKRVDHQQSDHRLTPQNGYPTPHHGPIDARQSTLQTRQVPQIPDQSFLSPPQAGKIPFAFTSTAPKKKEQDPDEIIYPRKVHDAELPEEYSPRRVFIGTEPTLERWGGIHVESVQDLAEQLASVRPNMPLLEELGIIDIRALTLSLKSGIKGEVRLALDTLCAVSVRIDLVLVQCGDLVDALIECAEEQVDLLADNAAEVSDALFINSYEDNIRGAKAENEAFQLPPEFGSLDFDLERAVDKLICITTILRNLSSYELNCQQLASATVVTVMANVMRYLGTRNMLLRTYRNTVDFTKDIVIYLSNVSQHIDLPGKEEALSVLHFLLSFAPTPPPTNAGNGEIMFSTYEPSLHCYLPNAVDSFAKLLAKDEPNRGFFRSIFNADGSSTPPFELLTRAFGLATSVVPEFEPVKLRRESQFASTMKARGPYVIQGLLAAEIIGGLIPASENSLARAWLASRDGFAANLIETVLFFGASPPPPPGQQPHEADMVFAMVANRGIAVLRKLAERAKDAETDAAGLPSGVLPGMQSVIRNLMFHHVDAGWLRSVCAYAKLDP